LNYILIKLGLSCLDEDFKKLFLKSSSKQDNPNFALLILSIN